MLQFCQKSNCFWRGFNLKILHDVSFYDGFDYAVISVFLADVTYCMIMQGPVFCLPCQDLYRLRSIYKFMLPNH